MTVELFLKFNDACKFTGGNMQKSAFGQPGMNYEQSMHILFKGVVSSFFTYELISLPTFT